MENEEKIVQVFEGKDSIPHLLDDVYQILKNSGGEVFISGIDEKKFLEADKEEILNHLKRLAKAKISERLLARDGDSFFLPGSQSVYRWVPENLFNPTPIYVYGDKVAMIVWKPSYQVIILKNLALADAYRKQFLFIWERAKVPPTRKVTLDDRKKLGESLIKRLGGKISSITDSDTRTFRDILIKEKVKTYGNSFYYMCQAANGVGNDKIGLKFFDGELLASIGIFNRASLGGGWHYHIIHPIGKFQPEKILELAKGMLELSGNPVFVKKLSNEQKENLLDIGFLPIEKYPWHAQAMEEDDTFPEQILSVDSIIGSVEGSGKREIKTKYKRFISKFGKQIELRELNEQNSKDALMIIRKFFDYLEVKELHISAVNDYDNIISHPPLGKNGKSYFTQLIYINNKPAAFFAVEPISDDSAGLFANITLHQEYPYLSEYLIVYICQLLKKAGYEYLNLGGSETSGLFQFKEKLSPYSYNKMHWVVYKID